MIKWEYWQTLLTVSRLGTYSGAAEQLGIDATTVGRRIKRLETLVGGSLFIRLNGKLTPSGHCAKLLSHLETASESLRAVEQQTAQAQSGLPAGHIWREICITAPPFLIGGLFAPQLHTLESHQQLRVELLGTGNNVSLSRREADLAIRIDDGVHDMKALADPIDAVKIGELRFAVYANINAPHDDLPWAGLIGESNRSKGTRMMIKLAGKDDFKFKVRHFEALKQIVRSGVAKAMLPCLMCNGNHELRQIGNTILSLPLWMLSHRQDRQAMHIQLAQQWIKAVCDQQL